MFFKRLKVFLKLKRDEIIDFGYAALPLMKVPLIIYFSLFAVFGGCYMAEKHLGWTGQYSAVNILNSKNDVPLSLVTDKSPSEIPDYPWFIYVFSFLIAIPLIGFFIIFSWLVFPLIIYLLLCFIFMLFRGCFNWLADNWSLAGEIIKTGEDDE